jgi:hypothetical protein
MNKFVQFLLVSHPAGGWFRRESLGKKKKKATSDSFSLPPDSHHSRNGITKRENPRFNPAP